MSNGSEFHMSATLQGNNTKISTVNILSSLALFMTSLFGLVVNSLYLWVLRFKMCKSVNTTWFFHLILGNSVFTITVPFLAVYRLMSPHWIFGGFLCKLINSVIVLCMYANIIFLTIISIDRYALVHHPVWYRRYMTHRFASIICISMWGFTILCSAPYFAFRQIRLLDDNKTTICYTDYTFYGLWDNHQKSRIQIEWIVFFFNLVLSFLLPFFVIMVCYLKIAFRMKKGNLTRSSKPYKIIFITVVSFFIFFIPYHIWKGMSIEKRKFHKTTRDVLKVIMTCSFCFHYCFTPMLYLFIVENFKKLLRKSLITLFETVFYEPVSS
ncbi:probable G-protein coupled receptor 33 [Xenopus laevis]|uniref:G-protein coupled receptors family 1 profile domain-containing protein n=2 Tax=Xenopus laevis TaxID=8355 RepID=A0A974CII2_XENLA|nr:probable G-protein coupled receptor 33 [Xenopus laevis]OCT73305.1 hypothetical protein XELAEV_18036287mg [Xenopus laevis]